MHRHMLDWFPARSMPVEMDGRGQLHVLEKGMVEKTRRGIGTSMVVVRLDQLSSRRMRPFARAQQALKPVAWRLRGRGQTRKEIVPVEPLQDLESSHGASSHHPTTTQPVSKKARIAEEDKNVECTHCKAYIILQRCRRWCNRVKWHGCGKARRSDSDLPNVVTEVP